MTRLSTKNAWAKYVRNRWRSNTVCEIQAEWDLTDWEARSLLYAQASDKTIDKVMDHKNGGPLLALDLLCLRFATTLNGLADKIEQEETHARHRREAEEQSRRRAASRLADHRSFDREA